MVSDKKIFLSVVMAARLLHGMIVPVNFILIGPIRDVVYCELLTRTAEKRARSVELKGAFI